MRGPFQAPPTWGTPTVDPNPGGPVGPPAGLLDPPNDEGCFPMIIHIHVLSTWGLVGEAMAYSLRRGLGGSLGSYGFLLVL